MKLRTVAILVLMACIVVATSAFGAYRDSVGESDAKGKKAVPVAAAAARPSSNAVVGASGAGTLHKQSHLFLDVSETATGPSDKDGPNTYRGKAGGYDLRDMYDSADEDNSDSDDDDDGNAANQSEFQRKMKYVKNVFKEIFSKWKSQESIMAPTSVEEQLDNPMGDEGFKIREKFKKGARQGMRKLKNAFRGRLR
jgi:hypothetical protein